MTTKAFQQLCDSFDLLEDWEDRYRFIIELGQTLAPMDNVLKTEATRVRGCVSQVWLYAHKDSDGKLHFLADSDAHIVRGLIAVVMTLIQGRSAQAIADTDLRAALEDIGLAQHLSASRTNGLWSMIRRIKEIVKERLETDG